MSHATDKAAKPSRLGRGLAALFEDAAPVAVTQQAGEQAPRGTRLLPVDRLRPGRFQPRRLFDETALNDLAESIRTSGVIQPLLVRPDADRPDHYEIIAGERRWRASQRAQLHEVPVTVRNLTDAEALAIGLVENLQREDLNPIEEADGYRRLTEEFRYTQEDLSKVVGKSRSHVANTLRLLSLPGDVRNLVEGGEISAGHARALLTAAEPTKLAKLILKRGLNVRQTEKLAAGKPVAVKAERRAPAVLLDKDADTMILEKDIEAMTGMKVDIGFNAKTGGGRIVLEFTALEQFDTLLSLLMKNR